MEWMPDADDALSRLLLQRGLALIYLLAFLSARNQFRGLLGEHGLTPIPSHLERTSFRRAPSLFHWRYSDRGFAAVCWMGILASVTTLGGLLDDAPIVLVMAVWAGMWFLYLSIVNVGQVWYGFGWESLLCEAGFLAIFLGPPSIDAPGVILVLFWWLLFRVEFGAGLIKLRGDSCWRDLTCLQYHHETQPMPNLLSWRFHHLPRSIHRVEVAANHLTQLVVPFALFAPQPIRTWAALVIIVTQGWLVLSGNFAWLNALTMVLGLSALDGGLLADPLATGQPSLEASPGWFDIVGAVVAVSVLALSWWPVRNLLSRGQRMNASFNRWHLVNSYGAFGSITRERFEIVLEGTDDPTPGPRSVWREYGFRGKPGDPGRRPPQVAPYHLRLDWLMWFAALSTRYAETWFLPLVEKLLAADPTVLGLLRHDPFAGERPTAVRARRFRYRYTTPAERRDTGDWWVRTEAGELLPPVTLEQIASSISFR